jgi:hypothetical protein
MRRKARGFWRKAEVISKNTDVHTVILHLSACYPLAKSMSIGKKMCPN